MTVTAERRLVIDTDVASNWLRGSLPGWMIERLAGATPGVTFVTVGELFRGAEHAGWGRRRLAALEEWLEQLIRLPADDRVARRWGEITGGALRAGRPLPANDAWIAACCLVHGASLATLNVRDFDRVTGLELVPAR